MLQRKIVLGRATATRHDDGKCGQDSSTQSRSGRRNICVSYRIEGLRVYIRRTDKSSLTNNQLGYEFLWNPKLKRSVLKILGTTQSESHVDLDVSRIFVTCMRRQHVVTCLNTRTLVRITSWRKSIINKYSLLRRKSNKFHNYRRKTSTKKNVQAFTGEERQK